MLHSTRFLNKLNKPTHMHLIHTLTLDKIPDPGPGLFRSFELLSTPVADSKLIGPLVDKWEQWRS